jgi:hypothetical protein
MGKGLSELQKSILKMAFRDRGEGSGFVKNGGVLIEVYGFPFHSPSVNTTSGSPQIFRRQEIGISRYRSGSVSVVKAFNRLVNRGLAVRKQNHGIILSAEGMKKAKVLSLE